MLEEVEEQEEVEEEVPVELLDLPLERVYD